MLVLVGVRNRESEPMRAIPMLSAAVLAAVALAPPASAGCVLNAPGIVPAGQRTVASAANVCPVGRYEKLQAARRARQRHLEGLTRITPKPASASIAPK